MVQRFGSLDVYAIRRSVHRTQEQFADALGIPANTVRSWEQRRKKPSGAARTLLQLIEQKPELLEALHAVSRRHGLPASSSREKPQPHCGS